MTAAALAVFVGSALVTLYIYFGYPALIYVMARYKPRPVRRGDAVPAVSMLVPVFNEEAAVEQKIINSLALDYPREKLEIIFISDGSNDKTEEIVRSFEEKNIGLIALPRGGKAAALNAGAAAATGEVLVLTDANVDLALDSLRVIARSFADPEVGGVSGKKKYVVRRGADTTEQGENLYWRWDQWQKELESSIGSIFAADGTLYAVRRNLYVPIDDPAQADDIAISTRVVLQGYRLIFDPEAIAYEEAPGEGAAEFRRKVRVTNHSVRALLNLGAKLFTSGFYSVELLSHKLVRHLIPFFLLLLLASNAYLAFTHRFFIAALALQLLMYFCAAAGALLRRTAIGAFKLFSVPYYFCLVNTAAFFGVLSILRGNRVRAWSPRGT